MNECSTESCATAPDLTSTELAAAASEVVVSTTTLSMMKAAVAAGEGGMNIDVNEKTDVDDDVQVAAWATRQLASPVHLQSLRVVYDKLVDRLDPQLPQRQQPQHQQQQGRMIRSLHLTCRLLLEIHRACELDPTSVDSGTAITGTVQQEIQPQQQLLTTSQLHSIETTEQRCRWLLEHDRPVFHNILAATGVSSVVAGSDDNNDDNKRRRLTPENPDNNDCHADINSSDHDDGEMMITNLCRRLCHNQNPATATIQSTEWTYDLARKNDNNNDNDNDEDDNDNDDDGALPSREELAAEEQMLWRMAETPIPS
jgi:hypothetical protein